MGLDNGGNVSRSLVFMTELRRLGAMRTHWNVHSQSPYPESFAWRVVRSRTTNVHSRVRNATKFIPWKM